MPYPEFPGDELAVKTLYKNISIQLINKRQRKPKEQSKTNNPETLPILGTQDTGRRQTQQKTKQIKTQKPHKKLQKTTIQTLVVLGKQDTGLLNVREHRKRIQEWAIQRHWQHWAHKSQDEDKQNIKQTNKNTTKYKRLPHRPTN